MNPPPHYDFPVTPWCLEKHMPSTGDTFVDSRRTDAIEYAFRIKDDIEQDLRKAAHCLLAAADHYAAIKKARIPKAFRSRSVARAKDK